MSDARDPRERDTVEIPPGGAGGDTAEFAAASPTMRADSVSSSPTVADGPGRPSPVVAETLEMPSPSVDATFDMPSRGDDATVDMPSSGRSRTPFSDRPTDMGSGAMAVRADSADDLNHDDATADGAGGGPARIVYSPARAPGVAVPGYELLAEIGRGGMGVVYKARHVRLDRLVALKMILAGGHASDDQIARFHIEARAVAQLQHPGIVQIHEDGDVDGLPYFALEFVPGGSLTQFINGKPQAPRVAARMVMDLCRAMAEAHARGIIHRDLKPANVLLTLDGKPKITDFGLAKQMEGDSQQTRSGAIMGTPSYMAPEQAWGQTREIGPLSDQYALGAILYEMIVGRPPFQGTTALETLELARNQEPVPPTRLQPKTPPDLETICLKALQKEPSRRYPDASAMADDLRRFLDGEPIVARPVAAPERLLRWCRRNPRVAGLAATVLGMMVLLVAGSVAFAAYTNKLNGKLETSNRQEIQARKDAQKSEKAAIAARNEAIEARKAETAALGKEREARNKAEALVKAAFDQNRNALEAQRVLSVLLNQRLQGIPGTQDLRKEIVGTTLKGLEATVASLEQLGTVAPDREGFAMAKRQLTGINQRAGLLAIDYGQYDEAARYFRRMEEFSDQYAEADPGSIEPVKVRGAVQATLGDFQMDRIGDSEAAIKRFDQALALRREWMAREPSNDEAKRGVANILGALARARLKLGDPAGARDLYREEIALRDLFSAALAGQIEVRREGAGLRDKLGDLSVSLGDPDAAREHFREALKLRERIAADMPAETQAHRDVLLSLQKLGTHEMIFARDPKAARDAYQRALDGFLHRLEAESSSIQARMDVATAHYYVATASLRSGDREAAKTHYRACRDIREELAKDPKTKLNSLDLMLAVARAGDHARASGIAEGMIKEPPLDARIYFFAACGFALSAGAAESMPASDERARLLRHYTDRALDALRLALKRGWKGAEEIATDPDLDPIRSDPGFIALLDEFRKAAK